MHDDLDHSRVDAAALRAARQSEREIVSRHTGEFAGATVALFVVLVASYAGSVALVATGRVPLWFGMVVNVALAYGCYTVHHEANHGNISGRRRSLRWVDDLLGRVVAVPITLSFRGFAPLHLLHHAHTNDQERDPDIFVAGPATAIPVKWLVQVVAVSVVRALPIVGHPMTASIIPPVDGDTTEGRAIKRMRRFDQLALVALVAAFLLGFGWYALLLWWLPGKLSGLVLMTTFQWLPHHPHTETDRYRNTRVNVFVLSTPALLEQDHHLMHHLFPRVPWYRYRRLFTEIRPILEKNNARIEGRRLGPDVPKVGLR
jgi:beta-carotene hydroxylase